MPNTITGAAILQDAMKYNGAGYVFGGAPASGIGHWDCSSFVSWVLGHDLHMSIPLFPNGSYTGSSHGAVAAQYLVWSGATTIPLAQAMGGDLACWPTHVGFVVDQSHMFSAYDTAMGTLVTGLVGAGPTGEPGPTIRRINAAVAGGSAPTTAAAVTAANSGSTALPGCVIPLIALPYLVVKHAVSNHGKQRRYV